jgi:uncharacterized protein
MTGTRKAVVGAAFLVLAGTAVAEESGRRHIEVTGEGEVAVAPDQVRLSFGIETFGKTASEAQRENARRTQLLLDALKKHADSKDVQSDSVQVHPRYDYEGGKRRLIDYSARKNFSVLLRKIASYGPVMEEVLRAGVEEVSGVRFQTSQREALEDEARKRAAADAARKARVLAEALGEKAGRPVSVSEDGFAVPIPVQPMALGASRDQGAVADQLAPGEIVIRGTVRVRFELE